MPAFLQGLKNAGFVEGRNISIEIRLADGHYDRLPSLAAELVRRDVAAIFANDVPATFAAKAATETIPIVFVICADPVKVGLVDSLSRPKGNLTGMSAFISVLGPKRVELLHEILPTADTIALLANPGNLNIKTDEPEIRAAADRLKHHLEVLTASTESDLEAAVNAGAKIHRFAGAKIHRRCWQEGPELVAFSSGIRLGSDCPQGCPSWHGVSGACSD